MMALPEPLAAIAWQEIQEFEEEKSMPYITTAERIGIEKGLAEGLAKGLAEGLEKGREEGREEGLQAGIQAALEIKFGPAGLALMPDIRCLQHGALLQTILDAAATAPSPDAHRQLWSGRD